MKTVTKIFIAVLSCVCVTAACAISCKASDKKNSTRTEQTYKPATPTEVNGGNAPNKNPTDSETNPDVPVTPPVTPPITSPVNPPTEPAEPSNPADSTENPSDPSEPDKGEVAGFVIGSSVRSLIVEGLSSDYTLNAVTASLSIADINLKIYLCDDGGKGAEVPEENYKLALRRGDTQIDVNDRLTDVGEYELTCTLVGAVYADGTAADCENVFASARFTIVNPVAGLKLISGTTEQIVSATDKISAGWTFEIRFANCFTESVSADDVKISKLETQSVGKHVALVSVDGFEGTVEYTVNAIPDAVRGFEMSLKGDVDTVTESGELTLGLSDFDFLIDADGKYGAVMRAVFIAGNQESESVTLGADDGATPVTVKAVFEYAVDGEKASQVFYKTVIIQVTKKPEEIPDKEPVPSEPDPEEPTPEDPVPEEPVPEQNFNLTVGAETLASLPSTVDSSASIAKSGKGEIVLAPQNGVTVTGGEALEILIDYENAESYTGLSIDLAESATVKITAKTESYAAIGVISPDGKDVCEMEYVDYELTEISFSLTAGSYRLFVSAIDVSICSIEVIFG